MSSRSILTFWVAALLACACLAALLSAPPAGAVNVKRLTAPHKACRGQNAINAPDARQERTMRCLINYARERRGLRRLHHSLKLQRSARRKSADIKRCGTFNHSACGRNFTFWMRRVGYAARCWTAAENIAWGQGRRGGPRSIFRAWLRSPSHRANMFSRSYSSIGVGLRKGRFQGHSGSQIWTTHFGKRC